MSSLDNFWDDIELHDNDSLAGGDHSDPFETADRIYSYTDQRAAEHKEEVSLSLLFPRSRHCSRPLTRPLTPFARRPGRGRNPYRVQGNASTALR